jgi:uncharacterized protein YjbJ (UPF0337 family)
MRAATSALSKLLVASGPRASAAVPHQLQAPIMCHGPQVLHPQWAGFTSSTVTAAQNPNISSDGKPQPPESNPNAPKAPTDERLVHANEANQAEDSFRQVAGKVNEAMGGSRDFDKTGGERVRDMASEIAGNAEGGVAGTVKQMASKATDVVQDAYEGAKQAVKGAVDMVQGKSADARDTAQAAADAAKERAQDEADLHKDIAGTAEHMADRAAARAKDTAGEAKDKAQGVMGEAADRAKDAAGRVKEAVGETAESLKSKTGEATQEARDTWEETKGQAKGQARQASNVTRDTAADAAKRVRDAADDTAKEAQRPSSRGF